jgi:hypothetical protein
LIDRGKPASEALLYGCLIIEVEQIRTSNACYYQLRWSDEAGTIGKDKLTRLLATWERKVDVMSTLRQILLLNTTFPVENGCVDFLAGNPNEF